MALLLVVIFCLRSDALESQQHRYDREYPKIGYSSKTPTDRVAVLRQSLETNPNMLVFDGENGYLESLLSELEIPVNSQTLVFSKTSINARIITPGTPRAIYFSDDTYVGWVQGSESLEIASTDPDLGIVFYTLNQKKSESPEIQKQTFLCLECHDTYGLTGGGVPRLLMGSGITDEYGRSASHEGWRLTDHRTPLEQRWGGWYVTGTHDNQEHLGNSITTTSGSTILERGNIGRIKSLNGLIADNRHLLETSDIVALMILEHQIHIQNLLIRLHWEASNNSDTEHMSENVLIALENLVEGMFLVSEAPINGPLKGNLQFQKNFETEGPYDRKMRSLRQLDLETRLFRYPFSYMIYSQNFESLSKTVRHHLFRRIWEVLTGLDRSKSFDHLSSADRSAILEILRSTKTDFRTWQKTRIK
ncbi:MAG TPA: hypothetical protein EYQ69_06670 [Gemmatimonadetes bacterium]|nr:hypothetical protein [Gemmatimonadota bacterium]